MNQQFAADIKRGLDKNNKSLSSKYFYDEKDRIRSYELFSEIMNLPEYYLTNSEFEIFQKQADQIIRLLGIHPNKKFELVELGAGDGYKTIELLKAMDAAGLQYNYIPVDISQKALNQIESNIKKAIPNKIISPKKGDYFESLSELNNSDAPKVVLFLGSNIGNMNDKIAQSFMLSLSNALSLGDKLILGADLIKSKDIVLPAYNDSSGVTSAFNLNLLERINREFDADFNLSTFNHVAEYEEKEGIAKSYIQSMVDQKVNINSLNITLSFSKGEKIHTEISRKYNDDILNKICDPAQLKMIIKLMEEKDHYDYFIFEKQ